MKQDRLPLPSVTFGEFVNQEVMGPMVSAISGELTASVKTATLGAAKKSGTVRDAWFSVGASGKDDDDTLSVALNVYINGTTCLSTNPVIAHVSGEVSQQKTTAATGDTGVTQAAIDHSADDVVAGDVLTYDLTLTRTSPTTEMQSPVVVVELEPKL